MIFIIVVFLFTKLFAAIVLIFVGTILIAIFIVLLCAFVARDSNFYLVNLTLTLSKKNYTHNLVFDFARCPF